MKNLKNHKRVKNKIFSFIKEKQVGISFFNAFMFANLLVRSKQNNNYVRGLLCFLTSSFYLLPSVYFQATAADSEAVLSVIYSQENANYWPQITSRLQASGVKYCVVPLADVRSVADWGDRTVLFMPNVESLTPIQAIALEEWMGKGGRLIASGPVGTVSAPGVRQLLRTLLGGYWAFSLNGSQKLQPSKEEWANQDKLSGQVRGGAVIPNDSSAKAAVWNASDSPTAVIASNNSTLLGWRWGVDTAASPELDTAWLVAAINRYQKSSATSSKVPGGSPNCTTSTAGIASNTIPPQARPLRIISPRIQPKTIQPKQTVSSSGKPINYTEAIAFQQELQNLIGRVESARLAANAIQGTGIGADAGDKVASITPMVSFSNSQQVISQTRDFVKYLPQLIAQKQYNQIRQQFLSARANLWQQFPLDRQLAQPEIRAVWLDRGTIVNAGSEQGLAQIFDRMAQAGINTVFFETVNAGYTIYPSQIAPQQNPLTRGWDPLAAAVKLAHERNMELHAWVWTFAVGSQRQNQILNLNPNYPGPILAAHPDWAGYDNRGQIIPFGQNKPFLDPANLQARQYLQRLFEEIVSKYDVDGLQLDYIRYPFQNPVNNQTYGYGQAARTQFLQLAGVDPISISPSQQDLWQKWTAFRIQQINSFVNQASEQLRQKRPNLILSVAVFPLPEQQRIQKIQQDWEVWARRSDIDLIIPMTYADETPEFQKLAEPWTNYLGYGSTLLVPGISLLKAPTVGIFDQIQLTRDLATSGYALFAAQYFNNDLYKVFNHTQGDSQSNKKQPIPYRQPFQTAAVRYSGLKTEWKFASQNDQLTISNNTITDFNSQVEVLQNALDQLATTPSLSNLIAARASLTRFQSQFPQWMRLYAIENPYQVKVWENRLAVIEKLLLYGNRVQLHSKI